MLVWKNEMMEISAIYNIDTSYNKRKVIVSKCLGCVGYTSEIHVSISKNIHHHDVLTISLASTLVPTIRNLISSSC